jgi:copper homeostasis protein
MEIRLLKKHSVDGFVFGVLDKEGKIDVESCSRLLKVAGKTPCTFHRAFDRVTNPVEALGKIIELGKVLSYL